MLADLARLILLILLLPLILILIGPLLVVAAIRGHQPLGPITLETARYKLAGRVGALALGLLIWLLVWGGLGWFIIYAYASPSTVTLVPLPASGEGAEASPSATFRPTRLPPTATAAVVSADTPTPQPSRASLAEPTPPSSPSARPLPPNFTPTFTPTPSPKTTVSLTDAVPTATLDQAERELTSTATAILEGSVALADRQAAISVVETGNLLLREAIANANEENLQELERVWRGLGLQVAKSFATGLYERYSKPLEVEFEFIQRPEIDPESSAEEIVVSSREKWRYGGPTKIDHEEAFEFIYTLNQDDGQWVISRYTYRNLVIPSATPTPE